MLIPRGLLVLPLLLTTTLPALADDLGIGSPAPKLEVKAYLKGEPVKEFDKGKVYVVELWATWCGPCLQSIPHLTELQKKHKDATFIGVAISQKDWSEVKPFVEKMGDKMAYHVAIDTPDGAVKKNWQKAAGQSGIPSAFIVNGDGKVAWIGHPMEMDKPLAQIVAGKYDLTAAAEEYKAKRNWERKVEALYEKLEATNGDAKKALAVLDKELANDAELLKEGGPLKLALLAEELKETQSALDYGKQLVSGVFKDNAGELARIAFLFVNPESKITDPKLLKFALETATAADELTNGKDSMTASILSLAYEKNSQYEKAVAALERALKLAKSEDDADPEMIEEMTKRLGHYKEKAKK